MPRNYTKKNSRKWTDASMAEALDEKESNPEVGFRTLQAKYKIERTVLQRHWKDRIAHKTRGIQNVGRKPVFSAEECQELRSLIMDMADCNFAPTIDGIADIVYSYVSCNNHTAAKKVFHYKGVEGRPGPDWLSKFMKECNLSLKEATKLSVPRNRAIRNPYVVYNFYEVLEKCLDSLDLRNSPERIWNVDETGFPSDPTKCKVVSGRGQKTIMVVPGSGRENTTVVAVCSASGEVLPPLIVHKGKSVQSTWRPGVPPGHSYYPWIYCNESGWMDSATFLEWFKKFLEATEKRDDNGDTLPRLVIFDGHMSHLWYETIREARRHNVTLIKLPAHTTSTLQPLDVGCFRSLKQNWENRLVSRCRQTRRALSKAQFAEELVAVWETSLSAANIKSGFRKCGIFPLDSSQYSRDRFDPAMLQRYELWLQNGRPELDAASIDDSSGCSDHIDQCVASVMHHTMTLDPSDSPLALNSSDGLVLQTPIDDLGHASPSPAGGDQPSTSSDVGQGKVVIGGRLGRIVTMFVPEDGSSPVAVTTNPSPSASGSNTPTASHTSFKDVLLRKLESATKSDPKPQPAKRLKVNPYGGIVTSDEEFRKAEAADRAKQAGGSRKNITTLNPVLEESQVLAGEVDICGSDDEESVSGLPQLPPKGDQQVDQHLRQVWQSLLPPVTESAIKHKWYAAINHKTIKRQVLYIGRLRRRNINQGSSGSSLLVELNCLSPYGLPDNIFKEPSAEDIDNFPISDVIAGPLQVTFQRQSLWHVADYPAVYATFKAVCKMDREGLAAKMVAASLAACASTEAQGDQ